jgi:hypothetical protein
MKKLLFAFPIVALLAAGCNSPQQAANTTPVQTSVAQNTNPVSTTTSTPVTQPTPTTPQTPIVSAPQGWKEVADEVLGVAVYYPPTANTYGGDGLAGGVKVDSLTIVPQPGSLLSNFVVQLKVQNYQSSLDSWVTNFLKANSGIGGMTYSVQGHVQIAGQDAVSAQGMKTTEQGATMTDANPTYFVEYSSNIYEVSMPLFPVNGEPAPSSADSTTFPQMVKTLTFFQGINPSGTINANSGNFYQTSFDDPIVNSDFYEAMVTGGLVFVASDGVSYYPIPDKITQYLGGEDTLSSTDILAEPNDPNIVFFSAYVNLNTQSLSSITAIYAYNLKTGELQKVYAQQFSGNNNYFNSFRLIGEEGSRLILWDTEMENSPGPCYDVWTADKTQLEAVDLANVSAGAQPYTIPADFLAKQTAIDQKCRAAM